MRAKPIRLQCFGRFGRVILNCSDVPVASLRQWAPVEVRFIELAQVDRFTTQWAICLEAIILFLEIGQARITATCLFAVTFIFSAVGFVL